jgi:hypothetical protein
MEQVGFKLIAQDYSDEIYLIDNHPQEPINCIHLLFEKK